MRAAYSGHPGGFGHQAAVQRYPQADHVGVHDPLLAMSLAEAGDVDAAVIPFEDTTSGIAHAVVDYLVFEAERLRVTGETDVPVTYHLLSRPDAGPIEVIAGTSESLAACRRNLTEQAISDRVVCPDLLDCVALLDDGDVSAVLAPAHASGHFELEPVSQDMADTPSIRRYVSVGRDLPDPVTRPQTLLFVIPALNRPGTLSEMVAALASRGINLTTLQSRPLGATVGMYGFLIEFEGSPSDPLVRGALADILAASQVVKYLGTFDEGQRRWGHVVGREPAGPVLDVAAIERFGGQR